MSEPGRRRGEKTREAILNAAEAVFAEHGFDGARIDAIAEASGFNKTLIFRYFGDKLGLYAAVLKRIDRQAIELQVQLLGQLFEDESIVSDAHRFRAFLKTAIGAFFDYMVEHPRVMRMMVWEHAEGWQTYTKLASLFEIEGFQRIETLLAGAQQAGLLRTDADPFVLFLLAEQICWSFPTSLPFYQMVLPQKDFSSARSWARAREQIVEFIVSGILVDPKDDETT
jgi:TetR/AcrR family transcriptional regulator